MSRDLYVPGIAYSPGEGKGHLWTAIFYERQGGQYIEASWRRSGATEEEKASPHPQRGLLRIVESITRPGDRFWLLFQCPNCGRVNDFPLAAYVSRCVSCRTLWTLENAVAEMAIEDAHWQESTEVLRRRMRRLAQEGGFSVSEKSLF